MDIKEVRIKIMYKTGRLTSVRGIKRDILNTIEFELGGYINDTRN